MTTLAVSLWVVGACAWSFNAGVSLALGRTKPGLIRLCLAALYLSAAWWLVS